MATETNKIKAAFKRYAKAYEDYHRTCKGIEIVVKAPRIFYHAGAGYEINGKVQKSTAKAIISALDANTRECLVQMQSECGELSFDAANPVANAQPEEWWAGNSYRPAPISEENEAN